MTGATWVVTGASGFVGGHVVERLQRDVPKARILCLGRTRPERDAGLDFWQADLEQRGDWMARLRVLRPDVVIHAAGRTPQAMAEQLHRANLAATGNLLDALRGSGTRVVLVGSAAELGPVPSRLLPADELCPCRPIDAYGLSKWGATRLGLHSWERWGLDVLIARLFNPIGPGQPSNQVFGRFARLLKTVELTSHESLDVGDTTARRDFLDVRDAARALLVLARQGRAGRIYHVGTGRSRSVGEGMARLIIESGRSVTIREADDLRPPALADSRAAIGRITEETDWRPRLSFEQSLHDLWTSLNERAERRIA